MDVQASVRDRGPREYKSRRYRPCDLCRSRRIACRIDSSPPCAFCQSRGSECTFLEKPVTKRRRTLSLLPTCSDDVSGTANPAFDHGWDNLTSQAIDSSIFERLDLFENENFTFFDCDAIADLPQSGRAQSNSTEDESMSHQAQSTSPENLHNSSGRSLHRSYMPPSTGHLSHLVVGRLLDSKERICLPQLTLLSTTVLGHGDEPRNLDARILIQNEQAGQPLLSRTGTAGVSWSEVEDLLSETQRKRLVQLFFRFIQPVFPILSQTQHNDELVCNDLGQGGGSLALAASIYATAIGFWMHDDHLNATLADMSQKRERLYSIALATVLDEAHTPSIEALQACLLILQTGNTTRPEGSSPTYPWLTSLATTMAKSLGLQHDCSEWKITLAEKQSRTRLWWATFIMDTWVSLDSPGGRSVHSDDYDVRELRIEGNPLYDLDAVPDNAHNFYHIATITNLLSRIFETYYTVRTCKATGADLFKSLELARPLRSSLNDCRQRLMNDLPLNVDWELRGNASVHLACSVVSIILFQALLRPIQKDPSGTSHTQNGHISAAAAVITGSLNSAKEAVQFLESMVSAVGPWNAFWHSWSQGNFAVVSAFLVQLTLVSKLEYAPTGMGSEVSELVSRWKRAIRTGIGSGGWGCSLMSLALTRLDSFLNQIPP
ncbi:hypothetical protein PV11_06781 [Exophiala sideris]|uniref:Zn(2)-C6 fungal-type domain-containing protein n=1 Tax=Exophiala sideris TaxID=1016849 RepID=A0A0D1VSX6_9EURO|nr:hypothetical protein PV11_06781 [Exophiala sideris]